MNGASDCCQETSDLVGWCARGLPLPFIRGLEFDEFNEAEMNRHHVTRDEVIEVWQNLPIYLRNAKRHTARYIMVGHTNGGRWLAVPIRSIEEKPGVWRPATAFDAPPAHIIR